MRRGLLALVLFAVPVIAFAQSSAPITREDGFVLMWNSLYRPVEHVRETQYKDVSSDDPDAAIIVYAKSRNILGNAEDFRPKDPLRLDEALVWLFRTRNLDDPDQITPQTLSGFLVRYPIARLPTAKEPMPMLTQDQLLFLMQQLDEDLATEVHEVSLYSEDFNGAGTAFGETFDMYALTAAHRTFPYNTLVKVTDTDNGKSVTVRINDRGPYVKGRDMDLSLGAFTTLAPRSDGIIHATFQRLGDASLVGECVTKSVYQQRITKKTILAPGVPHTLHLGATMAIRSTAWFVMRAVVYPDGTTSSIQQWLAPNTVYTFKPSIVGDYVFTLSSADGHSRTMTMHVADCGNASSSNSSAAISARGSNTGSGSDAGNATSSEPSF